MLTIKSLYEQNHRMTPRLHIVFKKYRESITIRKFNVRVKLLQTHQYMQKNPNAFGVFCGLHIIVNCKSYEN